MLVFLMLGYQKPLICNEYNSLCVYLSDTVVATNLYDWVLLSDFMDTKNIFLVCSDGLFIFGIKETLIIKMLSHYMSDCRLHCV